MKKNMCELQRELETMLEKRSQIRSAQMERYRNGSATRAMTTTSNAAADRINDRIIWLRDQLEKIEDGAARITARLSTATDETLRERLRPWLRHGPLCPRHFLQIYPANSVCDCGLDAALEGK